MNRFLTRLLGRSEPAPMQTSAAPEETRSWSPWDWFEVSHAAGEPIVTPETSVSCSAVWACVRVLSESVASLPLHVYRRLERGKERDGKHALATLLHDEPNPLMSSFTWREVLMAHVLLWGNAYSRIERKRGVVVGLVPIAPDRVIPDTKGGKLVYRVATESTQETLEPADVLHVPGLGFDGVQGYSPIRIARTALQLTMSAEKYGARFFRNAARPSGVLKVGHALGGTAYQNIKESWKAYQQGAENSGQVVILEDGMEWQSLSMPHEDAQFLETRQFQVAEIARIFRVPPHLIGDLTRSTYSNIEMQSIEFVTHSVRPWLVRIEQELNRKLFRGTDRFVEFSVDGLLRGDIRTRYQAYAIGRQNGWLSANDIRAMENQNPIDDGDVYLNPVNLAPASLDDEPKPAQGNQ